MDKKTVLSVKNLKKHYPIQKGIFGKATSFIRALDGVSFDIKEGETLGIVGESGCGKSTLAKSIMKLHDITSGEILINLNGMMRNVFKLNHENELKYREEIQMVFQDPYSSLNSLKRIGESFDIILRVHGMKSKAERDERMNACMRLVNLRPDFLSRFPHEFSGGQRQRICIARSVVMLPNILILDEPVSALDVSVQAQVLNLLKDIQNDLGLTYVFIAHDLSVVQYMSDRIIVMYMGKVVEEIDSKVLHSSALHPYTKALLSAVPVLDVDNKKKKIILEGDVPSHLDRPTGCCFHTRCSQCVEKCKMEEPLLREYQKNGISGKVACHLADLND